MDIALGSESIKFNWYYNISQLFYLTLTNPNASGNDESTSTQYICLSSNHLISIDGAILVARELVVASTTVMSRIDSMGPAIKLVLPVRFYLYYSFTITIVVGGGGGGGGGV